MPEQLSENELWMLSLYRKSEIGGALFFGKLASVLKPGPIQFDMTRHFSDESRHAWEWTRCIERLGSKPLELEWAYQDRYLKAVGVPANLMEVLAITRIFERRVFNHYSAHRRIPGLRPEVKEILDRIIEDEKRHLAWVSKALREMEGKFGSENVNAALRRCSAGDWQVYRETVEEHAQRLNEFKTLISDTNKEKVQ